MNQDSEQNDRRGPRRAQPNREGDSQRRPGRSVERRDDVRNQDADRPRFNREADRPTFNRANDAERPRFKRNDRDNDTPKFQRERNPRFEGRNGEGRSTDQPRLNRENDRRQDRNEGITRSPRFEDKSNERPRFNRDDKPRFDRNRSDESRSNGARRNRDEERGEKPRRDVGSEGTKRFDRNERSERPDTQRRDNVPSRFGNERNTNRFDRERSERSSEERPRFSRDERSREEKPFGPSRENRTESSRNDNRFDRSRSDNSSGFSRNRNDRSDNASFKRVGGFNRDADERNKEQYGNNRRRTENPNHSSESETRFSNRQRKDSGDRRTGDYSKAPNYNLEQTRFNDSSKRDRSDRPERPRSNRSDDSERRQPSDPNTTRLNRYIANSGVCSRREADELIARGDISVNGKVVTEMGYKVKDGDTVKYGTKVLNPERFVYVLLNKPKDYITTTDDPEERKTVMELVADAGNFRMYPVGRLDRNTTGLLLLTNDGELADKLTHPSNNIRKIYQVELDKPITDEHFEALKKGIDLEDGPIKPDAISIVTPDAFVIGIEIHSGRNRIVRRMFETFGYEVTKLDRTTYAGLTKKELPRGKWRFLDPKEVVKLKYLN